MLAELPECQRNCKIRSTSSVRRKSCDLPLPGCDVARFCSRRLPTPELSARQLTNSLVRIGRQLGERVTTFSRLARPKQKTSSDHLLQRVTRLQQTTSVLHSNAGR